MEKFDRGVAEVAAEACGQRHGLRPAPCAECLIRAARADERMVVESETQVPVVPARVVAARRMRAAGARITHLMAFFGIDYATVWSWLHADHSADARPAVSAPLFVGAVA